jgi:hypothetical protein
MFEVIVTYRPDFVEQTLDRYQTQEEARAVAERLMAEHRDRVIRTWVRQVRQVRTKP